VRCATARQWRRSGVRCIRAGAGTPKSSVSFLTGAGAGQSGLRIVSSLGSIRDGHIRSAVMRLV